VRTEYEPWDASNSPVAIDIVIERQLFVLLDGTVSKYAHANMASDSPFGDIAVGTAAVVRKPADAPSLGGIDKLRKSRCKVGERHIKMQGNVRTSSFCSIMK
jgi:hypothetical protein